MGTRYDFIQSLMVGFESKTTAEKQAIRVQISAYKAEQHRNEYSARLPFTVNLGGGAKCTILAADVKDGNWVLTVEFKKGNQVLPFENPWVIANPPLLWPDPAGDVALQSEDENGAISSEMFSENLLEVGKDIIARMYAQVSP